MVTETDRAVESMVSTRLREAYPTFSFVGEETYEAGVTKVTDAPTFVVDPIDGTTNFVHGFPVVCISLGFVVRRRPVAGVVYNPFQDLLFTAVAGRGAYMQRNASLAEGAGRGSRRKLPLAGKGDPARAPPLGDLSTALVAVEWGTSREGLNYAIKADAFRKLAASKESGGSMVQGLRSLGSAALNLCALAAGQLDVYWEGGCYAWDVAAGWCILSEAGGIMASGNPGDWDPALDSRVYLAVRGAPGGQRELVEEFWKVIGDRRMEYKH
jgi:myo-inositol-1(or 4)-monophosphatase